MSPLEIRKQAFRKVMRGFDVEEVRAFLEMVADEYEEVLQENGMLSEKVRHLEEQLEKYRGLERTLQNSIVSAEQMAADMRERAKAEADRVLQDARMRAERILGDSRERLKALSLEIRELRAQKDLFIQRFASLLDTQARFLSSKQEDLDVVDRLEERAASVLTEVDAATGASEEDAPREGVSTSEPEAMEHAAQEAGATRNDADPTIAVPQGQDASEQAPRSGEGDEEGFFPPAERREGFFELTAEEDKEGS